MEAWAQNDAMPTAIGTYGPWTLSVGSSGNFEYCELSNANLISTSYIKGTESSILFLIGNNNVAEFALHLKPKTVFPKNVSAILAFSDGAVLKVPMRSYNDSFIYDFQSNDISYHLFVDFNSSRELQVTIPKIVSYAIDISDSQIATAAWNNCANMQK